MMQNNLVGRGRGGGDFLTRDLTWHQFAHTAFKTSLAVTDLYIHIQLSKTGELKNNIWHVKTEIT